MVLASRSAAFPARYPIHYERIVGLAAAIALNLAALLMLSLMGAAPSLRLPTVIVPNVTIAELLPPRKIEPLPPIPLAPAAPVRQVRVPTVPVTPEIVQISAPVQVEQGIHSEAETAAASYPVEDYGSSSATPDREAQLSYLDAPPPRYPSIALARGLEGTVMLSVRVAADGSVEEVRLLRSSGHRVLDLQALRHVREHWRFQPAWRGGSAVSAWANVPVQFTITD